MDELMFSKFFTTYGTLSLMPWDALLTTSSTLVQEARNIINDTFLDKSTVPYLLMLDSDVLPPPDLIERLMADDKPVVGGWYRKKEKFAVKELDGSVKIYQRPVVYDFSRYDAEKGHYFYGQRLEPGKGLERVDAMGAGCWLVKREVIEKIGRSPFSLNESGEDMCFCRAVYKAGYEVWVDWDIPCGHAGVWWV
jgi:GT2 family glycosyltransferase